MRVFTNFRDAYNEIRRDLKEMGIRVHPHSYQDVDVRDNPDYATLELQNYIYVVTQPRLEDFRPTQPWADAEFQERIIGYNWGIGVNPGKAWQLRREVWEQFLQRPSYRFSYTYSERLGPQLRPMITELKQNPESRQLFLSVWDPCEDIYELGGKARVPCSLGYLFQVRQGTLNLTYLMRSCDFVTHFENDAYLAVKLLHWVAEQVGQKPGLFTHYIGSLHVFMKDVKEVF